jgi:hypothetical protein
MLDPVDGIVLSQVTKNVRNLAISEIEPISLKGLKFAEENVGNIGRDKGILKLSSGEYLLRDLQGAGKVFTTAELRLLKRADLPDFVRNNLDNLLTDANKNAIWSLTDEAAGQFKRVI